MGLGKKRYWRFFEQELLTWLWEARLRRWPQERDNRQPIQSRYGLSAPISALAKERVRMQDQRASLSIMRREGQPITQIAQAFSATLRGYRAAIAAGDNSTAEALLAWGLENPMLRQQLRDLRALRAK